jgi:hypothetical protein
MYNFNEDTIRVAAYYIWKNNGCKQGTALSDWDAAIHQLSVNAAFATKMSNSNSYNNNLTNCSAKKSGKNTTKTLKNVKSIVLNPISALKSTSKKKK